MLFLPHLAISAPVLLCSLGFQASFWWRWKGHIGWRGCNAFGEQQGVLLAPALCSALCSALCRESRGLSGCSGTNANLSVIRTVQTCGSLPFWVALGLLRPAGAVCRDQGCRPWRSRLEEGGLQVGWACSQGWPGSRCTGMVVQGEGREP